MIRKVYTSKETAYVASNSINKIVKVYSFFPVDKADCDCKDLIKDWKRKLAMSTEKVRKQLVADAEFLVCPSSKVGKKRFKIVCKICKQIQGYCWATDHSLMDWVDFHYVQWTKGTYWYGCFTPHISPVTQKLCFECTCGNDTRDFRANMTLSPIIAEMREEVNKIGRDFGKPDSKFVTSIISNTRIGINMVL